MKEQLTCEECGGTNEVFVITEYWSCGGQNCFHFEWRKFEDENKPLCYDCEENLFFTCSECGAFIDYSCLFGAEEYDDKSESVVYRCPECKEIMEY